MKRFSSKARVLQWLDRRVGAPVCFGLTLIRRLIRFRERTDGPVKSILFLKLAEQGSTVLAHEAIRSAVERVGRERVYFLVFEENRFILDLLGLVPPENVLTIRTATPGTMVASGLRRMREIRRLRFDACVDLEFFARFSAAIAFLSGARRRVGFHAYFSEGPYRGDLLTHRVLYNSHLHTARTFASLVLALDVAPSRLPTFAPSVPPPPAPPRFEPDSSETAAVRDLIASLGVPPGGRLVLLNANASDLLPLRKWEAGNYVALARRLLERFPEVFVGFTGAPDEASRIEELVREVGSARCVCFAGRTTLRQLLVVYGCADILVTNDSGPAHFAALTPIDVVALFGPETPLLFAAPGPRSHPIWAGLACSPCVNAYNNRQTACRDNICMKAITVDQVFSTVERIYLARSR